MEKGSGVWSIGWGGGLLGMGRMRLVASSSSCFGSSGGGEVGWGEGGRYWGRDGAVGHGMWEIGEKK